MIRRPISLRSVVHLSSLLAVAGLPSCGGEGAGTPDDGPLNQFGNPLTHSPRPTSAEITVEDLRTRIYVFAADSMEGRQIGRPGNKKATDYIAAELARLGVEPAGENGTFFQTMPYVQRRFADGASLSLDGQALTLGTDFMPVPGARAPRPVQNSQVVYGGVDGDATTQISPAQAAGKFVILSAGAQPAGGRGRAGGGGAAASFPDAAAVAVVDLDALSAAQRAAINNPQAVNTGGRGGGPGIGDVVVTNDQGGVGVLREGALVGGALSNGQTAASVLARVDSIQRAEASAAAATAARRAALITRAQQLAASGAREGTFTYGGETMALDSVQINTLGAAPAAAGAGRGGGAGAAAGGRAAGAGAPGALPPLVGAFRITEAAAARLLGRSLEGIERGATGGMVSATLSLEEQLTDFGRNVIGLIRGSDPTLAGQYVVLGAHPDHTGMNTPVDHDSLKAFNDAALRLQMQVEPGDLRQITPAVRAAIRVNMDSIRSLYPVARMDSVNNGADDDGSGSMALLEIAEAIAAMPVKPKRSILFVWNNGEETGLLGSNYFANNPTVPLDSIVANVNMDMIGRGRAEDMVGGGPDYLGSLGARRLSSDLDRMMREVNAAQPAPLRIDYRFDDPTLGTSVEGRAVSWPGYNNIYGRSDHANYAAKCIPIVFFFTGLHGDYHQRTDEPQYLDYPHYARTVNFIRDLSVAIGNAITRPALDLPCVRR